LALNIVVIKTFDPKHKYYYCCCCCYHYCYYSQVLFTGQLLGTNLIHDFTAVTHSVKSSFIREKRSLP